MDTIIIQLSENLFGLYARNWRNSFGTPLILKGSLDLIIELRPSLTRQDAAAYDGAQVDT